MSNSLLIGLPLNPHCRKCIYAKCSSTNKVCKNCEVLDRLKGKDNFISIYDSEFNQVREYVKEGGNDE